MISYSTSAEFRSGTITLGVHNPLVCFITDNPPNLKAWENIIIAFWSTMPESNVVGCTTELEIRIGNDSVGIRILSFSGCSLGPS